MGRAEGAANFSEALLGAHLYETLVRLDCTGAVRPGLAVAWRPEDGGWGFRLRPDATLWDGEPVTAVMVVSTWPLAPDEWTPIAAPDGRVVVRVPAASSLDALAGPGAAIRIGRPGGGIPMGSGPYGVVGLGPDGVFLAPTTGSRLPVLAFQRAAGMDVRDVLDRGADVLVTDDPAVAEYAAGLTGFEVIALPWDRTYVYASSDAYRTVLEDERVSLAREVVPAAARPADPRAWPGRDVRECAVALPDLPLSGEGLTPHVVYDRDDPIARSLAERIVALAADRRVTSLAVTQDDLRARVDDGRDHGYVVAVPQRLADPCMVQALMRIGAVPLVDVRRSLIVRRGVATITVDGFGIPTVRPR